MEFNLYKDILSHNNVPLEKPKCTPRGTCTLNLSVNPDSDVECFKLTGNKRNQMQVQDNMFTIQDKPEGDIGNIV